MVWESIGSDEKDGLNVALNEATWIGITVDLVARQAQLLLQVLSLPQVGPSPSGARVLSLGQTSRIVASYRHGRWDEAGARVEPVTVDDLDQVVRGFGGCPLYGWEFIDPPEESWAHWRDRLSLDLRVPRAEHQHVLDLFQAGGSGPPRHLDLRVWFNDIQISTPDGRDIPLADFIADGIRWWDSLYSGDPRTDGSGIVPG